MTIGIYALYWEEQDLIYIGQSQNIESRFKEHLYKLEKQNHTNYKVQDTYNKYGNPKLVLIEKCDILELNNLEIYWTNEFDSINNGLNIVEAGKVGWGVNSNASKYTKWQILKVFSLLYKGKLSLINISTRCKVSYSLVQDIRRSVTHLWLRDTYPNKYELMLTFDRINTGHYALANQNIRLVKDPTGIIHEVLNIESFARKNGLNSGHFNRLINGKRKTHKGWVLVNYIPG